VNDLKKIINNAKFKNVMSWVMTFVVALVLALFINTFIVRVSQVEGKSMEQTYFGGNTVFVSRLPYLFGANPKHGDIVVLDSKTKLERNILTDVKDSFKYNLVSKKLFNITTDKFWIKRVIGVAGDKIEFKNGSVYRNDVLLEETYVNSAEVPVYQNNIYTIEKGYIFVMGDNRNHSEDSRRSLGMVPIDHIIGKALGK